jgi:predicted ATP-dependent serine protease
MAWDKKKSTTAAGSQANIPQQGLVVTRAADLKPQKLSRVWNGRFVLGKIGFIVGEPGLGKSLIAVGSINSSWCGRQRPTTTESTSSQTINALGDLNQKY